MRQQNRKVSMFCEQQCFLSFFNHLVTSQIYLLGPFWGALNPRLGATAEDVIITLKQHCDETHLKGRSASYWTSIKLGQKSWSKPEAAEAEIS